MVLNNLDDKQHGSNEYISIGPPDYIYIALEAQFSTSLEQSEGNLALSQPNS